MGKRKSKVDESTLTEEERERRERQRQQIKVALEVRARGEEYINVTEEAEAIGGAKGDEADRAAQERNAAKKREVQKAVKKERSNAPDIVIVPIFWKGEAKQMAKVLGACADVQKALAGMDKRIELDAGHKYTPGQKFAHWEHKGVMLRVEVGPREAERGCCTVARTWVAGEQAHRVQKVAITEEALPAAAEDADGAKAPAREEEGDTSAAAVMQRPRQGGGGGGSCCSRQRAEGRGRPRRRARHQIWRGW